MTITIDAPPAVEATIMQEAAREGLSVPEYTLRALLERTGKGFAANSDANAFDDAERRAIIERLGSGEYARAGFSTDALITDRREETRPEDEQDARREALT